MITDMAMATEIGMGTRSYGPGVVGITGKTPAIAVPPGPDRVWRKISTA